MADRFEVASIGSLIEKNGMSFVTLAGCMHDHTLGAVSDVTLVLPVAVDRTEALQDIHERAKKRAIT